MMQGYPTSAPTTAPSSKVELKIRCRNLLNRDVLSFSDPQVFLFLYDNVTSSWGTHAHAMTEQIKDSLNPVFVKGLEMPYRFETVQRMKFVVFDIDCKHSTSWKDQDYLGEVETDLGSIIGAIGGLVALDLQQHKKHKHSSCLGNLGQIIIRAEELSSSKRVLNFAIRGLDLTKKGLFKTRPSAFFVIQRDNGNGTFSPVFKSGVIESEDDPIWKAFSIKESVLCNGDPNRLLKIEVMNHKESGTHTLIGVTALFTASGLSLLSMPHTISIPPMSGTTALIIQSFSVTEPPSFIDFLAGGGTLSLSVAIDFTQSNGAPSDPASLHFKSPDGENEYTRAIRSVGGILQCYDTDKKFPVFGFGGRVNNQVSHAFALNGNPNNPEVYGVDGILDAYWKAHQFVELYGPTNFAPVIMEATSIAKRTEPYGYSVLLILTDGAITDMDATVKQIQKASHHALSIIIVGVGHANFGKMDILDGDNANSTMKDKKSRDIVQFVAAREFIPGREWGLTEALLAEVPDQFMEYMVQNKIKPSPPVRIDTAPMFATPVGADPVSAGIPLIPAGPITPTPATPSYAAPTGPPPPLSGSVPTPTVPVQHPIPGGHSALPTSDSSSTGPNQYAAPAGPPPALVVTTYPGPQPQQQPFGNAPSSWGGYPGYGPPPPQLYVMPTGTHQQQPFGTYPSNPPQHPPQYPPQYPSQYSSQYPPQRPPQYPIPYPGYQAQGPAYPLQPSSQSVAGAHHSGFPQALPPSTEASGSR